ncbi:hypothetical protein [Bifidobacterium longum]|uniref:hypothetical protein n=1 Tax=Bifidobacterium longum TaxID=216816 RepID=UPI0018A9E081|nr:hypothetical protein [Bifidobacterium longum]MDB6881040.1 hypothetical protein [Bifidobacterium longum]MDB6887916.1 hypothetical protein [Bifidobacterium longum]MDB6891267.1 hypothetical protein [Bifidobacterium longum]
MRGKKIVTVTTLLLLLGSLAACGVRQESTANDKAEIQLEAEDAIKGTDSQSSQEPLIDNGLHGECSGSDPRLQSVKIDTNSYKIRVEIPNNSSIRAGDYYGYYINFTNDSGKMWQAGFKNVVNLNETSVFVFDMGTSRQNNLGTWNDLVTLQDGSFYAMLPNQDIRGTGIKWNATLSIDGQDVATCPADGSDATLE